MQKNYIIPFGRRFTSIGKYPIRKTVMNVDGIGIEVRHEKDVIPTENDVRRHMIGWSEYNTTMLQANSLQEAVKEFLDFPECKTGLVHKAWELINTKENPIIEYIGCKWMNIDDWGCSCKRYDDEFTEKNSKMFCVLDGLDEPPSDCPINKQMEGKGWRKETISIGGIWVQQYNRLVKSMEEIINPIKPR